MPRDVTGPRTKGDEPRGAASRRTALMGAAALTTAGALAARAARAQTGGEGTADFLFVQTAAGMAYDADRSRLTLRDVGPVTLLFSDRPERIAGNMSTRDFVPFWSDGSDSFLADPPNADLSILADGELQEVVVVLRDPILDADGLHYTVEIIDGDMPANADNASLFIDIIGMPLTPLSFAGVRRRTWRRAVLLR